MRILMVSDDFLPNPGGIAAHVYELSRAIAGLGHAVDLIVGHDAAYPAALPPLDDGVRVLSQRGFRWNALGYARTALATAGALRRAQQLQAYDVCHWHSLIWETWGVAAGAHALPRVFTNHSSGYLRRAGSKLRLHTQLRAILHVADQVIAPSRELLERSADGGYPRVRLHYIANGVDTRVFSPGAVDAELARGYGLSDGDRVLIAPRRLDPKNGIDVLIRALPSVTRAIPRLKLLLVGDGNQRAQLVALVNELGVQPQVVFCGSRQRQEMTAHLRLAQVAVVPSRAEAVSLAGLEAMAVGLPVVGSRVGGIPEFVRDGENGLLVRAEDPAALADALIRLLKDDALCKTLGTRARASVDEGFSWRAAAQRTLEVYAAAIAAAQRDRPVSKRQNSR